MQELTEQIQNEIKKAIIGKDDVIRKVLMAVLAQGHILLEDIPGVGKTTLAMAFARALGLDSRRIQFTSDTLPSDIIGFSVYEKESGKLQYKSGAIMTNLLLADEINRTSSKTQSALLEGNSRWRDPSASGSVCGTCNTEPGWFCRYTASAVCTAGPFSYAPQHGISGP